MIPTQARLKQLLKYNATTGKFTWRIKRGGRLPTHPAGSDRTDCRRIPIDGCLYPAPKLAILYRTGKWPDHVGLKDGNPFNTRWRNLFTLTQEQHIVEGKGYKNSTTGLKGVTRTPSGTYQARLMHNGLKHFLGYYPTPEQAAEQIRLAKLDLLKDAQYEAYQKKVKLQKLANLSKSAPYRGVVSNFQPRGS